MINEELINEIHRNATAKGFWNDRENPLDLPNKVALIADEVFEAYRTLRQTTSTDIERKTLLGEELADVIIRVLDVCAFLNIDILTEVRKKHDYNKTRPYKHGKKF